MARALSLAPYLSMSYKQYFTLSSKEPMGYRALKKYFVPVATTFLANVQFRGLFYVTGVHYSSAVTGNLAMTHRIMQAPVNLMGASLRKAFFLEFTNATERDIGLHNHIRTVWKYGTIATVAIFPIFFWLVTKSKQFIPAEWHLLPKMALAMYPAISLIVLLSWLDRLYDAFHKQTHAFYLELVYTIALYSGVLSAVFLSASPITMMLVYSVITTIYNILWTMLSLRMIKMPAKSMVWLVTAHVIILIIVFSFFMTTDFSS
jgi:hypothetical protein